jgi:exodeoxyribonuclease-5
MEVLLLLDTLMVEGPSLPAERRQRLFYAVMEDYAHIPSQRDRIKAVKEDRFFNALEVKYGYALTCHKSQGGQWSDVYLDLGYINPDHLGLDFYRWLYTGITRARERLYLVNMSDEMVADEEAEEV